MLCFEISVNGEKLFTAGVGEFGVLTSVLSWARTQPEEPQQEAGEGKLYLSAGGLKDQEHSEWLRQKVNVGDAVTIKIIESAISDEPQTKERVDPEQEKQRRREYYERCKREFEAE